MALTYLEAIAELNDPANAAKYSTTAGLLDLIRRTSMNVSGAALDATTMLYSGQLTDQVRTSAVAALLAENGDGNLRLIDGTDLKELLNDKAFERAAIQATGSETAARAWMNDDPQGAWAEGSARFVAGASGNIVTLTPFAASDRIFAMREIGAALDNPAVTAVNGIPKDVLLRVRDATITIEGPEAALKAVIGVVDSASAELAASMKVSVDANGRLVAVDTGRLFEGTGYAGQELPPGTTDAVWISDNIRAASPQAKAQWEQGILTLGRAEAGAAFATNGMRVLGVGGTVLMGASAYYTAKEIEAALNADDINKAKTLLTDFGAQTAGGWVGASAAASLAGQVAAPLLLGGPGGWGVWLVLTGTAGLVGGFWGAKGAQAVLDAFKDPVPQVSMDGDWTVTRYSNGVRVRELIPYVAADGTVVVPSARDGINRRLEVPDDNGGYQTIERVTDSGFTRASHWAGIPDQSQELSRTESSITASGAGQIKTYEGGSLVSIRSGSAQPDGFHDVASDLNADGTLRRQVDIVTDADGALINTVVTTPTNTGVRAEITDALGNWLSVTETSTDSRGYTTTSTSRPDGLTESVVRNPQGQVTEYREVQPQGESTVARSYDPSHTLQSTTVVTPNSSLGWDETTSYPDGSSVRTIHSPDGTIASVTGTAAPLQSFGAALTDLNSLVQAIRSGQPLPVLNTGLRLLDNQVNPFIRDPVTGGTQTINNQPLFTTTAVVGAIASVYGLVQAFEGAGSGLNKISAGANAIVAINSAANAVANQIAGTATGAVANAALDGAAQSIGEVVPYLNIVTSLANGDYTGAAIATIAAVANIPVIGWIYAAYSLIVAIDSDTPEAWGTARFKFADGTTLTVESAGEGMGLGQVEFLMKGNDQPATLPDGSPNPQHFSGVLGYLNDVIAQSAQSNPDIELGIIPQRLPQLTWHEARQDNPGYSVVEIDPLTGEARYPELRYNDNFAPINADATDPAQRRDVFQRLVDSALSAQAIAPIWEVRTARLQQDNHDPDAGLTEEERAANHGLSAPADADGKRLPGKFRPVVLDLDGDGSITTVSDAASNVSFDWDDGGYLKQTGWVGSGEGLLVLDRNLNNIADSGRELFSNGLVSDAAKGIRSMAWVDANADGVIDASDPVFAALSVWQDANQDGVQEASETHSLSSLGITRLDYNNGRFTRNGQEFAMQSSDLEASNDGVQVNVVQGGIQVDYSNGHSTLFVTQVIDLGGGSGQGTNFVARDDGFTSWEDGVSPGNPSDPTYPHAQLPGDNQPISISFSQLLANDALSGSNAGLSVTAVGSGTHGTPVLNLAQGTVEFTPEHNYIGQVSFEYTVTAPDGRTRLAHALIDLQAVNDAPVVSTTLEQRPVYGYGVYARGESVNLGGENGYEYRVTVTPDEGPAQYAAYYTVAGQTISYVDQGESGTIAVYGPMVDTRIPKEYFDHQYGAILSQQWNPDSGGPPAGIAVMLNGQAYYIAASPTTYLHGTPIGTETSNDGRLSASDPDGGSSQFRYEFQQDGLYGHAVVNETTGQFTYTGLRYVDQNLFGEAVGQNVDTDDHLRNEETHTDVFQVKVVDLSDPTGHTFTLQDVSVTHFGPLPSPNVASGAKKPIAIDLNGDGFHFTDVDDSNVFYDVNGDGWRRKIAWNNPADGFIAYDKNGDGKIDRFDEISFVPYKPDGQTDLEGLKAFDTNGDGMFTAADDKWASFGVWQDANSNGVTDSGEFRSLNDLGINGISLTSDGQFRIIDGQTVHGVGVATKADGSTLALADASLRWRNVTQGTAADGTTVTAPIAAYSEGQTFTGTADADLVFGTAGSDQYHMGDGNDVVTDDTGDDLVDAGAGDDIVFAGAGKDYVDAGDGTDSVFTGDGDDLAVGGGGDDFLSMGGGNDVAFGADGNDMLSGGTGNDLLSGDKGDDKLFGEGGWDVLFGMDGDDELWGGDGNDQLHGGAGNDLLSGGAGDDTMEGGIDNDTYEVDSAADVVTENVGEGFDTVRASINYTLGANLENLTLTGTAALEGTGNAADNRMFGNDANNTLRGLDGNDTLDGGQGADLLVGGTGDDTYIVDNTGDAVVEAAGEGVDTLQSRITTTLAENIENLTLIGIASINGTGNALDNVITGNDAANRIDGGTGADRMLGGAGHDTYVVDNAGDQVVELVGEGYDTVESNINAYTLTDNVEALILGAGAVSGTGNALANTLSGNAAANTLYGGAGADAMAGGAGDDIYVVDNIADAVIEQAGEGNDSVLSSVTYTLAGNVENLTLAGAGNIDATGNELANALSGNAGNNVLNGAAGADSMSGGAGDDGYIVDDSGDQVIELAGQGTDRVSSGIDYTLAANVEQLTLTGSAVRGTGNDLDNVVTGNAQDNTLDGAAGADSMAGGAGNDAYIVDNAGDTVTENANDGIDTVLSSGSCALSANVEHLTLTGTGNTNAAGNELANVLTGNVGNNLLDGGAGADTMAGGDGDDSCVVDNAGDQVIELTGEGYDRVSSSIDYVLTANVEQLTLTGSAISGTGNALDNLLFGNAQSNILDGGAGADTMAGSSGNDTYIVDNSDDQVIELASEGFDRVSASIDYVLTANVEQLTLTGAAIRGTANALDNLLFGNDQANILDGVIGADQMSGGLGDDRYVLDNAGDIVVEAANAGIDTVIASVGRTLEANVENLVLVGDATNGTGNELANVLVGNAMANTLSGGSGNDVLAGGSGSDVLDGGIGDDLYLYNQGEGRDSIADASGTDTVRFGAGMTLDSVAARTVTIDGQSKVYISVLSTDGSEQQDQGIELSASGGVERFEFANGSAYTLADLMVTGRTLSGDGSANTLTGDRRDDTINAGGGNDIVYGRWGNDTVYGGTGADKLFGEGGNDKLYGESEADQLWGGAGQDVLEGGSGADLLVGGTGNDSLNGGVDKDVLDGGDGADLMVGDSGEDQLFGGAGDDILDGGTDADLLAAGDGDDVIRGGTGNGCNVIVAGAGNDRVDGGTDRDFIDGSSGDDVISTSSGSDFIAAGTGNDVINTGADRDLIAFNRGDGADVVVGSGWDRDTLSLGGGIRYADLTLRKDGNDLVLDLGSGDSVTFDDWYTDNSRRSVDTLQMVTVGGDYLAGSADRTRNRKAVSFDFGALVTRFDQVRASNPGLTSWPAGSEINTCFKASSDTTAIGGDLAHRYATTGSYGDLDWLGVRNRMSGMNGSSWQALAASTAVNPWTALRAGLSLVSDQSVGLPSPITPMASPTGDELVFAAMTAGGSKPSWMGDQPARMLP